MNSEISMRLWTMCRRNYFWIILFFGLLVFFIMTPLMVDDFTYLASWRDIHSVSEFFGMMGYFYEQINGRVAGNSLSLLLAGSWIGSAVVRALILCGVVWCAAKLFQARDMLERSVVAAVVFFVPVAIFNQSIAWRSGFYNYVPPVLALLVAIYLIHHYIQNRKVIYLGILFLTGAVGSMFIENMTIAFVLASTGVLVYAAWYKYKVLATSVATWFIGVLLGTAVMFLSPTYHTVDSKHPITNGPLIGTAFTNLLTSIDKLLITFWPLVAVIVALTILLIFSLKIPKKSTVKQYLILISAAIPGIFLIFSRSIVKASVDYTITQKISGLLEIVLVVCMYGAFISALWWYVKDKKVKFVSISLVGISLLAILPLLKVPTSTIQYRIFYPMYTLQALACLNIALYLCKENAHKFSKNSVMLVRRAVITTVLFMSLGILLIFSTIAVRFIDNNQAASSQIQSGKTTIVLKKYPFDKLLNPTYKKGAWPQMYYANCHCQYRVCHPCDELDVRYR